MTRIIGGTARGRRLQTPRGERTRPTSDRVREALFSSLESWCGSWHGLRLLDLYAGSGAVGLEAWSRGAQAVVLVEQDRRTAGVVLDNVRALEAERAVEVRTGTVRNVLAGGPPAGAGSEPAGFDVVFADPPYPLSEADLAADLAALPAWLAPGALVVLERSRRSPEPTWPEGLRSQRSKRYGETTLWYGHAP